MEIPAKLIVMGILFSLVFMASKLLCHSIILQSNAKGSSASPLTHVDAFSRAGCFVHECTHKTRVADQYTEFCITSTKQIRYVSKTEL